MTHPSCKEVTGETAFLYDAVRQLPFPSTKNTPKPSSNMTNKQQEYYNYLNGPVWKEKRRSALDFYGRNCALCAYKHNLQVHHRHYNTVFNETMQDLIVLCEACHERFHKFKNQKRQEKKTARKQRKLNKKNKGKKDVWKNGKESKYMVHPSADKNTVTYYPYRKKFEDEMFSSDESEGNPIEI